MYANHDLQSTESQPPRLGAIEFQIPLCGFPLRTRETREPTWYIIVFSPVDLLHS